MRFFIKTDHFIAVWEKLPGLVHDDKIKNRKESVWRSIPEILDHTNFPDIPVCPA